MAKLEKGKEQQWFVVSSSSSPKPFAAKGCFHLQIFKNQNHSDSQILREINFGHFEAAKTGI